jgi:Tat protein secretion system quality control protein TatD with DNase activity
MSPVNDLPDPSVLAHITDVHCHPTDAQDGVPTKSMEQLQIKICAMSTTHLDQEKVKTLANEFPDKVTPAFGHHPWFSHWISTERSLSSVDDSISEKERHYRSLFLPQNSNPSLKLEFMDLLSHLPDPIPLTAIINTLRDDLLTLPNAMLGEVGLDRSFRIPFDFLGSPRVLTSFHIPLEHQLEILEAQMAVAVEMERNVSLHSVKSQLATLQLFERMEMKWGEESWRKISIDMHSCGFSKQGWIDLQVGNEYHIFRSVVTTFSEKARECVLIVIYCDKP